MSIKDIFNKASLPLIAAPMFLVSTPELALACCKQGVVGSFPALNQRSSAGLEEWLIRMNTERDAEKDAPYAVNLIVHKTNPRLQEDLALCVKHKVPVIITSLGAAKEVVDAVHSYGGIVLHDVANVDHAKKAAAAGVDGLIAVGAGAGGHAGVVNPFALVGEIRSFYKGFIALAGCLSSGQDILAAQALGADAAYMGTRFIATQEAAAVGEYKDMIKNAKSSDVVYTPAVSGIPANFLKDSLEKAGFDMERIKREGMNVGQLKSLESEAKAWKNVWSAGQGVGVITDTPTVEQLVTRMKDEYSEAQDNMLQKSKSFKISR